MITYKQMIKNINSIISIESAYLIAHSFHSQFKNELNEYTICVISLYIKRCINGFNDNIIDLYTKHIKEKESEYFFNEKGELK